MCLPSVSIIIPVYNVEPYVEECLRSVILQTYDGTMECIIVDDCGTDNSMAIVERVITDYCGPILFKVLHHDHNRGLSAARNTGMDVALGDYLFFLDSDDYLSKDCLEKLVEPLHNYRCDVIVGNYQIIDDNCNPIISNYIIKIPDKTLLKKNDIIKAYSKLHITPMVWGKLYLSDFIRKNDLHFKEGILHEDQLWSFQVYCLSDSLFVVNNNLYFYRRRDGSITSGNEKKPILSLVVVVVEMGEFIKSIQLFDEAIYMSIRFVFYSALKTMISTPLLFIHEYKFMHHKFKPSILEFMKVNIRMPKRLFRDIHLLLPPMIAPYFEYGVTIVLQKFRYLIRSKN